jgi:glucan endo-1,3-beta-glucosidase A1 domain protein
MNRYHTYAVEWEEDVLTFFADGKRVFQYKKQNDSQEQWPFDKSNFYLILNQSVGNGSWAKNADVNHTYEMCVDWIRVYQKEKHLPTSISVPMTKIQESTESNDIYSLQGAKMGTSESELPKGIYVSNGRKFVK